jgi:hypothetical protein
MADEGPAQVYGRLLANLQVDQPEIGVDLILPGPPIITNPDSFPTNDMISKYITETKTSQKARYNKPSEPSKLSGLLRLKSPVAFESVTLPPSYLKNNEIRLEKLGNPRRVGVFSQFR